MFKTASWTVTRPYQQSASGETFASLDKIFALEGEQITQDRFSDVIKVNIADTNYYVKRYTSGGSGLRKYMGRSRIRAEWENMLLFHSLGVPAANVVAYGEECSFGMLKRGALITEEFANSSDLHRISSRWPELFKAKEWTDSVIHQIATSTRVLHENNFNHTDLKWRNILISLDCSPRIALIDCPAGETRPLFLARRGFIKDLACLDKMAKKVLSRSQRLKFFKIYRQTNKLNDQDKEQIRKVLGFF